MKYGCRLMHYADFSKIDTGKIDNIFIKISDIL